MTTMLATIATLATTAFCRIVTPTALEYAPDYIAPKLAPPTAADYAAHGWLVNAVESPEAREGMVARLDHYEAAEGRICAVYAYEPLPPVVKRYRVAYLLAWVEENGLTKQLTDALGISVLLQAASIGEISADNEDFAAALPLVKQALGLTDEQLAACLDYAEVK